MKQRSAAQQKALERYPNAKRSLNDFSMAQGYAACYQERVEPLIKALRAALSEFHNEDMAYPDHILKELERHN